MNVETKTIKEICKEYGCTLEEWNKTVDELMEKGIGNGCYQDYGLLAVVIERLTQGSL